MLSADRRRLAGHHLERHIDARDVLIPGVLRVTVMAKCLFCREDGSSREHVVPEGIGGRKSIDRVCKPCNSDFGTRVDAKLVDHPFIDFERARLGIAGKSDVPQPLAHGTLASDPKVRVKNVVSEKAGAPKIQTGVVRSINTAGEEVVRVVGGTEEEVLKAANKRLTRAGHAPLTLDDLRKHARVTTDRPEIAIDVQASLVSFRPALVKIAYEVAWMALGDVYLDDAVGENVRAALRDRDAKPEDLGARLGAKFAILANPLVPFFQPGPDVHTIALFAANGQMYAWVRIFSVFETVLPIAAMVRAGAQKIITVDPVAGTWTEEPFDDALFGAAKAAVFGE